MEKAKKLEFYGGNGMSLVPFIVYIVIQSVIIYQRGGS